MSRKKGRTRITIYHDWCKGCGLCVAFCPAKVFALDATGKARVVNEAECTNCGFCELHCPDFAIIVQPLPDAPNAPDSPDADETAATQDAGAPENPAPGDQP